MGNRIAMWAGVAGIIGTFIALLALVVDVTDFTLSKPENSQATRTDFYELSTSEPESSRTPQTDFNQLSIRHISQLSEPRRDLGKDPGIHEVGGVPFDLGWVASTQCVYLSERPRQITLDTVIRHPRVVYMLFQSAGTDQHFLNMQAAVVRLVFASGKTHDTPLILGVNLRDWATERYPHTVSTTSSSDVEEAWREAVPLDDRVIVGVVDMLTIEVPDTLSDDTLTSFSIIDTSVEKFSQVDPCIHLLAVTVEYAQ